MAPWLRASVVAAVSALTLAGCALSSSQQSDPAASASPGVSVSVGRSVGPAEFEKQVADPSRLAINVHVPFEGAIPGTDLMIPYDGIERELSRLPQDRTSPLAIYCRTGRMSAIAAATLAGLGYTNVVELQGGMQAWEASGRGLTMR